MKKAIHFILAILCPLFVLSKGFILNGSIEGLQSGRISLAYVNEDEEDTTLTATITGGTFTFIGSVPEPELAKLTITEGWTYYTWFFLENASIAIHLVKDSPEKTSISGSVSDIIYEKLKPGLNDFFSRARQNESVHHQSGSINANAIRSSDSLWAAQQRKWIQSIRSSFSPSAGNYAALYFIRWLLFKPENYDTIREMFMQLSPDVRQSLPGKKFLSEFEHAYRISSGQAAPEIVGRDTSGRSLTLSLFKGKVVLLDFWASYCGPCRQENRLMLPVYEKFHSAGFEILSFSLDNERPSWLLALQNDGMIWPQASELRGGASATAGLYEITELPRNVLLDRVGKIYVKDVHGEELIDALKDLLVKGNRTNP